MLIAPLITDRIGQDEKKLTILNTNRFKINPILTFFQVTGDKNNFRSITANLFVMQRHFKVTMHKMSKFFIIYIHLGGFSIKLPHDGMT